MDGFDIFAGVVFLKAHRHQFVGQPAGGLAKGRFGQEGIRLVEFRGLAPRGVGHSEDATEQLFRVFRALDARDRAEDVRKGAVPAFLEGLHRDDVLDFTGGVKQVDPVQLALNPGGDGDLLFGNLLCVYQVLFQDVDRHLPVFGLRLEQDERANEVRIAKCRFRE